MIDNINLSIEALYTVKQSNIDTSNWLIAIFYKPYLYLLYVLKY